MKPQCETWSESNYLVALEKLRSLARIAFVTGYEAGKNARGESVAAFIDGEARRFDMVASQNHNVTGNMGAADRCGIKAGHSRTLCCSGHAW